MMFGESLLLAIAGGVLGVLLASWLVEHFREDCAASCCRCKCRSQLTRSSARPLRAHGHRDWFVVRRAAGVCCVTRQHVRAPCTPVAAESSPARCAVAPVARSSLRRPRWRSRSSPARRSSSAVTTNCGTRISVTAPNRCFAIRSRCSARITARRRRSRAFYRTLGSDFAALPGVQRFGYMSPTVPPYDGLETRLRLKGGDLGTPDGTLAIQARYTTNDTLDILDIPLQRRPTLRPAGSARQSRRRSGQRNARAPHRAGWFRHRPHPAVARTTPKSKSSASLRTRFGKAAAIVTRLISSSFSRSTNSRSTPSASSSTRASTPNSLIDTVRKTVVARDASAALHWITTMEEALDSANRERAFLDRPRDRLCGHRISARGHRTLRRAQSQRRQPPAGNGRAARRRRDRRRARAARHRPGFAPGFVRRRRRSGRRASSRPASRSRLYGITARDPIALLASAFLLIIVALLACWLPARRAARTDPMTALRAE